MFSDKVLILKTQYQFLNSLVLFYFIYLLSDIVKITSSRCSDWIKTSFIVTTQIIWSTLYSAADAHTPGMQSEWGGRVGRTKKKPWGSRPLPVAWHPAPIKGLWDANIAAQYRLDLGKIVKHCTKKPSTAERKHHSAFLNYLQLPPPMPFTPLFKALVQALYFYQKLCTEQWIWGEKDHRGSDKFLKSILGNSKDVC